MTKTELEINTKYTDIKKTKTSKNEQKRKELLKLKT